MKEQKRNETTKNNGQGSPNGLFFLSSPKEVEKIVCFLGSDLTISNVITRVHSKQLDSLHHHNNSTYKNLCKTLMLNEAEVLHGLNSAKKEIYYDNEIANHDNTEHYLLSIAYTGDSYVLTLTFIDKINATISAYINTIINNLPGAIYWKDREGRYMGCNQFVAEMAGVKKPEDLIGMTDFDLCWNEFANEWRALDLEVINKNKTIKREEKAKLASGKVITELTFKAPLINEKKEVVGIIGTSLDITDKKEMEQALIESKEKADAANLAKTKFITNMSHDIRTPLSGIVGLSNILMDDAVTEANKENARLLNLSGEQLLSLLNAILELIASESFEHTLEESSFELKNLINDLFELELPALKIKDITLDLIFDEQLPAIIKTDKGKLYRVLLNLLSNAIKFTNTGGSITLKIEQESRENDEAQLRFTILDTGIGIPKTEINKIFNAFYRVHPSYEGNYEGLGVGLHLVRQYVDQLQGRIEVKSIEGMGTQFKLTIPVEITQQVDDNIPLPDVKVDVKQEQLKKGSEASQSLSPAGNAAQHKILLVEDNPMAMQVAKSMLSKYPFEIYKATTATEALNLFIENDIDIVLSDIGLPDFSGFELAKKMKAEKKHCPPIIGLTAHAKQQAALEGQQSGMREIFEKPLSPEKIQILLSHITDEKSPKEQSLSEETTLPLMDEKLAISYLGSEAELKEMLDIMLKHSMTETIELIRDAYQKQNMEALKQATHKFKSSCLYCATSQLLHYTQKLENQADHQNASMLQEAYNAFFLSLETTKDYIEQWLLTR